MSNSTQNATNSQIKELCKNLHLPFVCDNFESEFESSQNPAEALQTLLLGECERRQNNSIKQKLSSAKFPEKKFLCDFDKTKYSPEFTPKFEALETLKFIENKENVILIGTPGAGKTHFATALGVKACQNGLSTLFLNVPELVIALKEALSERRITLLKQRILRFNLIILDELGYVSFDKEGSELLFNLLSARHRKGSVIITTNLAFPDWAGVFGDTTLTGALIDRLAHKAHVLDISREKGGRLEETIEWLKGGAM